uniref:F-box domain-containing protein n=1 Tax=Oryza punctata TaxID=4537 RepID=A0A0E0M580_ORYPU
MAETSPLHRITGAAVWDAEPLLGRLIILAHAAFLDAGFVPTGAAADDAQSSVRLPRQVGTTASALSLRYTAPQLLHRQDAAAATVALRVCAHGRHVVFYWICLDALAAAALLAGGLDDTARALVRDARLAALWSALTDRLCRRVLVDLCVKNGVLLEPEYEFMSLSDDVKVAILARLARGEDLARVECTCVGLRRLVAERDSALWKPMYKKLLSQLRLRLLLLGIVYGEPTEVSWKVGYVAARRRLVRAAHIASMGERLTVMTEWVRVPWMRRYSFMPPPPPESPEEETVPRRRRRRRAMPRDAGHGHAAPGHGVHKKQWHGAGAVHSLSSRFRWKHR